MDEILRKTCLDLLSKRAETSTICPSVSRERLLCALAHFRKEIPRFLAKHPPASQPKGTFSDWRSHMDAARDEVWKLAEEEIVEVTQGGEVRSVDERESLKGPIRVKRGKKWSHKVQQDTKDD
jgi:hypothetical protein